MLKTLRWIKIQGLVLCQWPDLVSSRNELEGKRKEGEELVIKRLKRHLSQTQNVTRPWVLFQTNQLKKETTFAIFGKF